MRTLAVITVVLLTTGLGGCNQSDRQREAVVTVQKMTKDELEKRAWDKTPREVRANLGPPTAVRVRADGEWWFYNHLRIPYDDGNIQCPQIHFKDGKWVSIGYMPPDKVEAWMNGDHWLAKD